MSDTNPTKPAPIYVDADDEMPEFQPRPRRRAHRLTFVLAALAVAAAGFYGGVLTQKHEDHGKTSTSSASNALAAFAARRAGATATGGAAANTGGTGAGGGGAFGNRTTGTVKFVDGTNVYITDANGNVIKVATSPASSITKLDTGTTKDIAPGQTVSVSGPAGADGTVTATSLTVIPAGTSGGLGFGGFGRGGAAATGG